jgi:hypothetical protein
MIQAFQKRQGSEFAGKCTSGCVGTDEIYEWKQYQLIENTSMFTSELLDRAMEKLNYIGSDDYIVKEVKPDDEKIVFFGDFHSSLDAFEDTLVALQRLDILDKNFTVQPGFSLMYMGDLVDRGPYGLEILAELALLADINEKGKVQCLKGNHEERQTYERYGFGHEVDVSSLSDGTKEKVHKLLAQLPRAVYVRSKGQTSMDGISLLMVDSPMI